MGNSESGNLDNDDTNWFNNDGDSFTSRHTNRRNQEVEKKKEFGWGVLVELFLILFIV